MNRRKIQLGLCRALLDSLELYGARINEDEYAVADRHIGYVFDCKEFVLDTGKIKYSDKIADIFKDREDDVELERTDRLRDLKKRHCRGIRCRRLCGICESGFRKYI